MLHITPISLTGQTCYDTKQYLYIPWQSFSRVSFLPTIFITYRSPCLNVFIVAFVPRPLIHPETNTLQNTRIPADSLADTWFKIFLARAQQIFYIEQERSWKKRIRVKIKSDNKAKSGKENPRKDNELKKNKVIGVNVLDS